MAVKVFRLDITPEQAQALARELTAAAEASLFHPSIVEPIAAGVQGTVAYRAEEYVPAESLDVAMRHYAPAPPDRMLPFITQLAGAVDFARAAGVGHGALHPRDVFVTPDEARLTGFGVVDALERVGIRAPVRRPYSAPERIAGEAWSTRADVFSLAVITFELLTGRRPAGVGEEIGALTGAHGEELRTVLARAMDADPARRYPSGLAFAAALEAAARGEVVEPVPPTAAAPADVPPPVPIVAAPPAAPEEPEAYDDIAAERDEDEAHWDLSLREQQAVEEDAPRDAGPMEPAAESDGALGRPASPQPDDIAAPILAASAFAEEEAEDAHEPHAEPAGALAGAAAPEAEDPELFSDEEVQAAGDKLVFDAADLALDERERGPADRADSEPPKKPAPSPPSRTFIPVAIPPARPEPYDQPLSVEQSGETRVVVERRVAMLPLAVTLMVGLLLGYFARGYDIADREASPPPTAADATTGRAEPAPAPSTSEPPAQTPPPTTQAAPSAQPDVPADAPTAVPAAPAPRERPGAPPAAARTGRIVVRSTPSRANVTINGTWRGRTPLTLENLAFGSYVVRVVSEGYAVAREEFRLSAADATRTLSVQLERQAARGAAPAPSPRPAAPRPAAEPERAFTGAVFVDSRPQGATVTISGKTYGKTPLRIPEVPIGSHIVRLELADHQPWSTPITVTAGAERRVTGSLEPIR